MKTMTIALVLVAAIGCSKDKPKATTTPTGPTGPTTTQVDEKPPASVDGDTQVSPSLAISGDIATACGIKVSPSNPTFETDQDELTADDRAILEQIATCLTTGALKGKSISLIGRADPRGTEEYNLGLGSRRAHSVRTFLERMGVGDKQMGVSTRGALDATGSDEASWKSDRRVDIQLAG